VLIASSLSPPQAVLKRPCPDGIDIFYDMVGGLTLDTVLPLLNVGARVMNVGTAGTVAVWSPALLAPRVERTLLFKRASL